MSQHFGKANQNVTPIPEICTSSSLPEVNRQLQCLIYTEVLIWKGRSVHPAAGRLPPRTALFGISKEP